MSQVLSQHDEEVSFLWMIRTRATSQPHYALKDLAKLDLRLEAHLDGLRIAGASAWDIAIETTPLDDLQDPGDFFALASIAFELASPPALPAPTASTKPSATSATTSASRSSSPATQSADLDKDSLPRLAALLKAAAAAKPNTAQPSLPNAASAIASAIAWLQPSQRPPLIKHLWSIKDPVLQPTAQHIAIAATAICRSLTATRPEPQDTLFLAAISHALAAPVTPDDPPSAAPLKSRALRALGELSIETETSAIRLHLNSPKPEVRFSAAWSGAMLRITEAIPILQAIALDPGTEESPNLFGGRALDMAIRRMSHKEALAWQGALALNPKHQRQSVLAAGILADPALIPWLFKQMEIPMVARIAGEAFSTITGADLAYLDLDMNKPKDFESGPTEDPEDENVELDADENLPWPNPIAIKKWWGSNSGSCPPGTRCLLAKPMSNETLTDALKTGRQRQRVAAAMELSLRNPGRPLFNTSARGDRQ